MAGQDAELFNFATDVDSGQRRNPDHARYSRKDLERINDESSTMAFRLLAGLSLWSCFAGEMRAQTPPSQEPSKPAVPDQKKAEQNPFAPEPAPPLPAGMTGSDVNDPRAKLTPGVYDAGEIAMGLKHLLLLKNLMRFNSTRLILTVRKCRRVCSAFPTLQRCLSRCNLLWLNWRLQTRTLRSRETTCLRVIFTASISMTSRFPLRPGC